MRKISLDRSFNSEIIIGNIMSDEKIDNHPQRLRVFEVFIFI